MEQRLALVFSGGGAKGAFGVGVLCRFVEEFPNLRWHIVAGTSTGALIAPLAALGATDRGAIGVVREMYLAARQKAIVSSNFGFPRILKSIVDLPEGVYNFKPLKKLVKETIDDDRLAQLAASDVACILNAVNLQTGKLVLCTQDAHRPRIEKWFADKDETMVSFLGYDRFRRAMRASSAVPAAVDPLDEKKNTETGKTEQLVDGGVLDIAPLRAAIAAGATHVIAVLMSPRLSVADLKYRDNLLQVATRSVDLLTDEILRNDVETADLVTRLHELANLLSASNVPMPPWLAKYHARVPIALATVEPPLPLGETFDFDSDKTRGWPDEPIDGTKVNIMRARMECGERTAAKAIAAKPELRAILGSFSAT